MTPDVTMMMFSHIYKQEYTVEILTGDILYKH